MFTRTRTGFRHHHRDDRGVGAAGTGGRGIGCLGDGAELGGALGISILGSVSIAIYRGDLATTLPAGLSDDDVHSVRDTLGAAARVASELPGDLGDAVLGAARTAYLHGVHITAAIAGIASLVIAVVALRQLWNVPVLDTGEQAGDHDD